MTRHTGASRSKPRPQTLWPQALLVLLVLISSAWYLYAEYRVAGEWGFSLDDSWIYATFARNIATGQGYSFNPGERIAGATGPLYALILAVVYALFRDVVIGAKTLGIACLCISAVLMYSAARNVEPNRRVKPLLVGLLTAASPSLLWSSVSGMEIPLFILVASSGIYFYTKERWTLAALCWSLGVWIRPDGLLLALIGIFLRPRLTRRSLLTSILAAAPVLIAFFIFNFVVGGKPLPNSVLVKTHPGQNAAAQIWEMIRQWAPMWGLAMRRWDFPAHSILLLPAIVVGAILRARNYPALGAYVFSLPLALAAAGASSGAHGRYVMPTIPFAMLLAVDGLDWAARRVPRWPKAAFLVLAFLAFGWQASAIVQAGKLHGWNVENINDMQRLLAGTIRMNTSPGDTIAVNDVGAIGYFSGCYVVDLVGLVSPYRSFPENLRIHRPKYLVIFPNWYRAYSTVDTRTKHTNFYDPDSMFKYVPVAGAGLHFNTISARDKMFIYARVLPGEEGPEKIKMIWH